MKEFNPTIKSLDEIQLVYYNFTGPYQQSFNDFGKLMMYAQSNKLPLGRHSLGIFYDDPETVPANELRSEVGFLVTAPVVNTETFKYKKIPAGKAVSVKYTSMEDIMPAYSAIAKYIEKNQLKTVPYSIEMYYSNDPAVIDAEIFMMLE